MWPNILIEEVKWSRKWVSFHKQMNIFSLAWLPVQPNPGMAAYVATVTINHHLIQIQVKAWGYHDTEMLSTLLALCEGNP